jgi:hypothetical protein
MRANIEDISNRSNGFYWKTSDKESDRGASIILSCAEKGKGRATYSMDSTRSLITSGCELTSSRD